MKSGKSFLCSVFSLLITLIVLAPSFSSAEPLDNWHWRNPLPQGNNLNDVNYCDGTFIAVGDSGTIVTSPDGITWTARSSGTEESLSGVTCGNGIFVAVGGAIVTSPDGITWTVRSSESGGLWSVAFGDGIFVAVGYGGTILTSTDGVTWTARSSGMSDNGNDLYTVAFGNNTFVAAGFGIVTSQDGVTWRYATVGGSPVSGGIVFHSALAFGNGKFVASVGYSCLPDCAYFSMMTSSDGATWDVVGNQYQYLSALTLGDGLFVGSDYFASLPYGRGILVGGGIFVGVGEGGIIGTSPDGTTWTTRTAGATDNDFRSVWFGNGTFVVALGDSIVTSPDGTTWKTVTLPDYFLPNAVAFGNNTFVAVGGTIATSPDGVTWTPVVSGVSLNAVAFGKGTFVAVGDRGAIVTSSDGITWTTRSSQVYPSFYEGVAYGNNTFVAVGGTIVSSPDGATWTQRTPTATNNGLNGVAFGNGVFVAVGMGEDKI